MWYKVYALEIFWWHLSVIFGWGRVNLTTYCFLEVSKVSQHDAATACILVMSSSDQQTDFRGDSVQAILMNADKVVTS